jgi:WhiB family redox-sensing transcriptional regulator
VAHKDGYHYRHIVELLDVPEWFADAACKGMDPALFFPEGRGEAAWEARRTCRTCPVQRECLEHAVATGERTGVWGGVAFGSHRGRTQRAIARRFAV